jgi:hypothetical protein
VWRAANILATRHTAALKPGVAGVLPLIGLLAESAESGAFDTADAQALRDLSTVDTDVLDTMLMSADIFTSWECEVPAASRMRLLERLDLYGIRKAVEIVRADPAATVGALRESIARASGIGAVRARLAEVFAARADGIKAAAALAWVTALVISSGDAVVRQRVRDGIEVLLASPHAHQLRVLEALTLLVSGAVRLPDDLVDEVLRVGSNAEVTAQLGMPGAARADLAACALERAGWWRSFASFGASPAQSRVAHVVHRAYFLIWQQLEQRHGWHA